MADQQSTSSAFLYQERLIPGPGMWATCVLLGLASFLVGAPIQIWIGVLVGIIMAAGMAIILYSTSPIIEITADTVRVGRAQIDRKYVGKAEAFRGEDARIAAGPALDGRAFMCFRGWIEPKVRIEITDPADPTPYWLASTRNPEEIVKVLEQ